MIADQLSRYLKTSLLLVFSTLCPFLAFADDQDISPLGAGTSTSPLGGLGRLSNQSNQQETIVPLEKLQYDGRWRLSIGAVSIFDELDRAQYATVGIDAGLNISLMDNLKIRTRGFLPLRAGQFQSRFNENFAANQIIVSDAYVDYTPLERLRLMAGVLNQGHIDSTGTVVKITGFPGLRQDIQLLGQNLCGLKFSAQQAIPTSVSLEAERTQQEAVPGFYTMSLNGCAAFGENLQGRVDLTHFRYENLPAVVASRSGLIGNYVNDVNTAFANFPTAFKGSIAQGQMKARLTDRSVASLGVSVIRNDEAPEGLNQAVAWFIGGQLGNSIIFKPSYQEMYREANVAPAFYTARIGGYTNRAIRRLSLDIEFVQSGFTLRTAAIEGELIQNINPIESTQREFVIGLETAHELF